VWHSDHHYGGQSAKRPPADETAVRLAAERLGLVDRPTLLRAGLSTRQIDRRIADGRLQPLHPGVYAVGHRCLTADGHRLAAVLAGGAGAVLSHMSAAGAWNLRPARLGAFDVTIAGGGRSRRVTGIRSHRCRLAPDDVTVLRGIPITTVARTLLDVAETEPQRDVDRALDQAVRLGLFDEREMGGVLERAFGRHGLKRLRRGLVRLRPDAGRTRSELEDRGLEVVDRYGLPRPEVNVAIGPYIVDLLWRRERLVVELDSRAWHLTPDAFEDDRRRDATLTVAGYEVLRFTWAQVSQEPAWVTDTIAAVLRARVAL
jgi:hypothetical protein